MYAKRGQSERTHAKWIAAMILSLLMTLGMLPGVVFGEDGTGTDGDKPIQYFNTWSVNNVYYFANEDPIPERTTQGTIPKIKYEGESSYVEVPGTVAINWTVTDVAAMEPGEATANETASVDENGLVTFHQPGKVKVWLVMTNGAGSKSASKTVSYDLAPIERISADGTVTRLAIIPLMGTLWSLIRTCLLPISEK